MKREKNYMKITGSSIISTPAQSLITFIECGFKQILIKKTKWGQMLCVCVHCFFSAVKCVNWVANECSSLDDIPKLIFFLHTRCEIARSVFHFHWICALNPQYQHFWVLLLNSKHCSLRECTPLHYSGFCVAIILRQCTYLSFIANATNDKWHFMISIEQNLRLRN